MRRSPRPTSSSKPLEPWCVTAQGWQRLEQWLAAVEQQGVPELRAFAEGLKKDYGAVVAGLTLEWSNDHVAYCTSSLGSRSF
jgi:hypothetical protein